MTMKRVRYTAMALANILVLLLLFQHAHGAANLCVAGQEASAELNSTCIDCAQGTFKPAAGSSICSPCPADTFSSSERAQDMSAATPFVRSVPLRDWDAAAVDAAAVISGLVYSHKRSSLYLSDQNQPRIVEAVMAINGSVTQVAVIAGDGSLGSNNGVGTWARFSNPSDLDLTRDGDALIVADPGNHLVRRIALIEAGGITQFATISLGYAGIGGYVDGSDSSSPRCRFHTPTGVRVHRNGSIFVMDSFNNRIRVISPDFVSVTSMGSIAGLSNARKLVFAAEDLIIISSASGVMGTSANKLTEVRITDSATIKIIGGGDAATVDGIGRSARFNRPVAMEWTTEGALLVGQEGDGAIRLVDWPTGTVSTFLPESTAAFHRMLSSSAFSYTPQIRTNKNRTNGVYVGAFTGQWPAWEVRLVQWTAGASACTACPMGGSDAGSSSVLECFASKPLSFRPSRSTTATAASVTPQSPRKRML